MFDPKFITLLAKDYGIISPLQREYGYNAQDFLGSQMAEDAKAKLLMDAAPPYSLQPQSITNPNAGVPAFLTNFLDPELVRVMTTPIKAAEIFGEKKKGDWTTLTTTFPIIESSGEVSTYGDYNNNGSAAANVNYEPRQSYHYQIFTHWGDRELEMAGLAKIDWAAEQNVAAALIMNKFQNKSYFYGLTGLDNYGLLNDPSLSASLTPMVKTAAGSGTTLWSNALGTEIFADIKALFTHLQSQLGGNVDMNAKITLAMSHNLQPCMLTPMSNVYGTTSVEDMVKKAFPNLTVKTAVEYATSAGELVQMFVDSVDGQATGFCGFTEKNRAHAIVRDTSSTYQKKSAGTWGCIIKLPAAIVSMIGC